MVDLASGPSTRGAGDEWEMRCLQVVDDPKRRLDRLVPLLHEMVAWGLVLQAEDGTFVLPGNVQERLVHLTTQRPTRTAQVYVGRKCQVCGQVRLTRMVEGIRRCASCGRVAPLGAETVAVEAVVVPKSHHAPFPWRRRAG